MIALQKVAAPIVLEVREDVAPVVAIITSRARS
jgi:hypothetical protein